MKIEKLNENSLKKYINDMELDYKLNISRGYFGIKKDDKFIFGYDFQLIGLMFLLKGC